LPSFIKDYWLLHTHAPPDDRGQFSRILWRGRGPDRHPGPARRPARRTWTMPPIESLSPPARSAWRTLGPLGLRTLGLVVLCCYVLAAITVLAVRAIQLALGSG
jgi:hypothetical protein